MCPEEIQQVEQEISERYENVAEAWPMYDTLIICGTMYGQEASVPGWFTSMPAFGAQERHSFFNSRTEALAHLSYSNKQTVDSMDFAMEVYSFGIGFFAPGVRVLMANTNATPTAQYLNTQFAHWWETEFPRQCSIEFKVQQDTLLELPAMAASPGYGPVGGGASFEHGSVFRQASQGVGNADYHPVLNMSMTQGVPFIQNRWPFPKPIQIPRTATIEAVLTISEYGRDYLSKMVTLNPQYMFGGIPGAPASPNYTIFPARFGIQVSLLGKRLVQQRAQYHR